MSREIDPKLAYKVVKLIVDGYAEDALSELAKYYGVPVPRIRIGRVKGKSKNKAVYLARRREIVIQDAAYYNNPMVVLHEFYHHLRNVGGKHRGTEKGANEFALEYIRCYHNVS